MLSITTFFYISTIPFITNGYYLSLSVLEWKNASRFCKSYCNSDLISLHNNTQYMSALELINNNNYTYKDVWIGLNDIEQPNSFVWSDASTLDFGSALDGRYPWRWKEPDFNSSDDSIVIEATRNNLWADKKQLSNYHFLCGSCSNKLTKYVAINDVWTYNEASKQCEERFGTTLASIHNIRDMEEAIIHCKSVTDIAGCWIGLNNKQIFNTYQWDDGTEFDFGTIYNNYPWYYSKPTFTPGQNCIQMDPYPEQYLWDDANCNITGRILCNAPSEICQKTQFFISNANEEKTANQWIWTQTHGCNVMSNVINMDDSVAIIRNKQYFNSNGILLVDMMYTMTQLGKNGNGGIAFYFDENNCNNYYVIGIWAGYDLIYLGKFIDGIYTLITFAHIGITYNLGTYYNVEIRLKNGIDWNVKFNDKFMFNATDINDTFNNIGNKYSGYIGIRNSNTSMNVKSLFISGDPVYINSNLLYLSCNNISTTNPTIDPTIAPTMKPTRVIWTNNDIGIDTTTSTMMFIDDDNNNNNNRLPVELEVVADLDLFWIVCIPI
eukprot:267038_1